jgi:hypothetical protein
MIVSKKLYHIYLVRDKKNENDIEFAVSIISDDCIEILYFIIIVLLRIFMNLKDCIRSEMTIFLTLIIFFLYKTNIKN